MFPFSVFIFVALWRCNKNSCKAP